MTVELHVAYRLAASRGLLCEEDVDLIREGVRLLPADRDLFLVDLGAGSGTSALSIFCERAERIQVVTIDSDPVALASAGEAIRGSGYGDLWTPLESVSWEAVPLLAVEHSNRLIDMLLVDADHSKEGLEADIAAWLPLVRAGAPVWFHDYKPTDGGWWPAVALVLDGMVARGELEAIRVAGWGYLCRKPGGAS